MCRKFVGEIPITRLNHLDMGPQLAPTSAGIILKHETSYKSPPTSLSDHDQDDLRGRKQDRDRSSTAKAEDESGDEKDGGDGGTNGRPRKRKRSRKGLEKTFACPHEGCGKSYSRAEHLYRHQLNRKLVLDCLCKLGDGQLTRNGRSTQEDICL